MRNREIYIAWKFFISKNKKIYIYIYDIYKDLGMVILMVNFWK